MSTHTETSINIQTQTALAGLARWALHTQTTSKKITDPLATLDGFYSSAPPLREDRWQERDHSFATHSHLQIHGDKATIQCREFALTCQLDPVNATQKLPRLTGQISTGPHAGSHFDLIWHGDQLHVHVGKEQTTLHWQNPTHIRVDQGHDANGVAAPMPGKVFAVFVNVGDTVKKGQPLIGLEAMKMEHTLNSPCDGVVQAIPHPVGDQVTEGTELIHFSKG